MSFLSSHLTRKSSSSASNSALIYSLKDMGLADTDSLAAPDIVATEVADELQPALDPFAKIAKRLPQSTP